MGHFNFVYGFRLILFGTGMEWRFLYLQKMGMDNALSIWGLHNQS